MRYRPWVDASVHRVQLNKLDTHASHVRCSDTNSKFHRKIEDLEDVRNVMAVLKEVREKESEIDNLIGPIEEMYGLLMRYEVRVPKEETTMVSDLRYGWKKLKKVRKVFPKPAYWKAGDNIGLL